MPVVTVWTCKGGAGKTTLAHMLGTCPELKPCIMVDMDPQQSLSGICGISREDRRSHILTRFFKGELPASGAFRRIGKETDQVWLLPGDRDTDRIGIGWDGQGRDPVYALRDCLKTLRDHATIVVDAPPGDRPVSRMALAAADWVLVPALTEFQSADGLMMALDVINEIRCGNPEHGLPPVNPDLRFLGLVRVLEGRGTASHIMVRHALEDICAKAGIPFLNTALTRRTCWCDAQLDHHPIWLYPGAARQEARMLADEMLPALGKGGRQAHGEDRG